MYSNRMASSLEQVVKLIKDEVRYRLMKLNNVVDDHVNGAYAYPRDFLFFVRKLIGIVGCIVSFEFVALCM